MTAANFAGELEAVLGELESATARLGGADPADLDRMAKLLAGRQEVVAEVARRLAEATPTPELAARLRKAFEQGGELEERLKLTRAATRRQMAELHRVGFHARAIASMQPPAHRFDIEA